MDKLEIVYKSTSELVPYENNPRNNKEAVDYVANSIKEFGFTADKIALEVEKMI